jgi:hypothetical protein
MVQRSGMVSVPYALQLVKSRYPLVRGRGRNDRRNFSPTVIPMDLLIRLALGIVALAVEAVPFAKRNSLCHALSISRESLRWRARL